MVSQISSHVTHSIHSHLRVNTYSTILKPDEEEKDFFETAAECPITPNTEAPLHRAMTVEEKHDEKN